MYSDIVLSDNPIAYYPLNEASGRIAFDSSGNGHNGSYVGVNFLQNQPTFLGSSLKFGGNSYIAIPDFTVVNPLTFEIWFNNTDSRNNILFSKFNQSTVIGFTLFGRIAIRFTPGYFTYSHDTYASNIWHYLVITIDSSGAFIFYMDGVQSISYIDHTGAIITTPSVTGSIYNNEPLLIGTDTSRYFIGYMMHFAIYDYVLSTKQIDSHRDTINFVNQEIIIPRSRQSNLVGGIIG